MSQATQPCGKVPQGRIRIHLKAPCPGMTLAMSGAGLAVKPIQTAIGAAKHAVRSAKRIA